MEMAVPSLFFFCVIGQVFFFGVQKKGERRHGGARAGMQTDPRKRRGGHPKKNKPKKGKAKWQKNVFAKNHALFFFHRIEKKKYTNQQSVSCNDKKKKKEFPAAHEGENI